MAEAYDINDILGLDDSMDDSDQELTIADILGPKVSMDDLVAGHTPLQIKWLFHFLNSDIPETFLQASASARAAGYAGDGGTAGWRNLRVLKAYITKWVDEEGLSPDSLRQRLTSLVHSRNAVTSLPALKMAMQMQGLLVDRKIIEGGDNPIRHSHEVILSPEIQAKLGEIYGE